MLRKFVLENLHLKVNQHHRIYKNIKSGMKCCTTFINVHNLKTEHDRNERNNF